MSEVEQAKRLQALQAAVWLCVNDDHATDIGTLKRTWFYSMTGRDEPVGSKPWRELLAMVDVLVHSPSLVRSPSLPAQEDRR